MHGNTLEKFQYLSGVDRFSQDGSVKIHDMDPLGPLVGKLKCQRHRIIRYHLSRRQPTVQQSHTFSVV